MKDYNTQGEKGMLAKGPELKMEILPSQSPDGEEGSSIVKINAFKRKKNIFKDDIFISNKDIQKLRKYIRENFVVVISTTI